MDSPGEAERVVKLSHSHTHTHTLSHTVTHVCTHLKLHKATRLCRIYYHHLVLLAIAIEMAIYAQILYFPPRIYNDEMHFTDRTIKAVLHMLRTSKLRASLCSRLRECKIPRCCSGFTAELLRVRFFTNPQKHHTSTKKRPN